MGSFPGGRASAGGVQLELNANQSIATGTASDTLLTWSAAALWDPDTEWTGGASTTFTVPAGWSFLRVLGNIRFTTHATGARRVRVLINDADSALYGNESHRVPVSASAWQTNYASGIIAVSPGDTVKIGVIQNSGGALNVEKHNNTWVSILKWEPRAFVHADLTAAETIVTSTLTEIPFDRAVRDDFSETQNPGWASANPEQIVVPGGSRRYHVYAGCELESAAGSSFLNLNQSNGSAHTGPAVEHEKGHSDANIKNYDNWNGPVIQNPSLPAHDNTFRLEYRHNHGSDRDLLAAFLQVEDARDSFLSLITKSANQTIASASSTTVTHDETVIEDDAGFGSGSANSLRVPARPGGGAWSYALIHFGQPWGTSADDDRLHFMEVDTGGGFAGWKGSGVSVCQASNLERSRVALTGFYPVPAEGDEFRLRAWQNTGVGISILGDANSQYFALELFR